MNDVIDKFRLAIAAAGLTPPTEIIDDGAIHRFSTNGKPTHKNGWYMLHTDGIAARRLATGARALRKTGAARRTRP